MFRMQDCVENLGRRLQTLNELLYRKEMKNVGRTLNWNCKGKKENRDDIKRGENNKKGQNIKMEEELKKA